jgi:hypothetical protein
MSYCSKNGRTYGVNGLAQVSEANPTLNLWQDIVSQPTKQYLLIKPENNILLQKLETIIWNHT